MFYNGLKPGVKLFRIVDGNIEISEVRKELKLIIRRKYKLFELIPIVGDWKLEEMFWYQDSKCFTSRFLELRPIPYRWPFYYVGTDFNKVMKKTIKCGMLEI